MGIIKQGILGGFSGKVAGVVGTSWKGIAVIKALPLSVANPKTAGQVAQRTKFSNASKFGSRILAEIIKPLWDRFAQKASGYNDWVRSNIDLFAASSPSPAADLIISSGKMAATAISSADATDDSDILNIYWVDDTGEGLKLATDDAYCLVHNETKDSVGFSEGTIARSAASLEVTMPENCETGDVINCYLSFRREDGTVVSNSSFLVGTF